MLTCTGFVGEGGNADLYSVYEGERVGGGNADVQRVCGGRGGNADVYTVCGRVRGGGGGGEC